MAEIAAISITIPGILSAAWTVLKAAYDLYGSVDRRRQQIGLLLARCRDLISKISEHLEKDPDAQGPTPSEAQSVERCVFHCWHMILFVLRIRPIE